MYRMELAPLLTYLRESSSVGLNGKPPTKTELARMMGVHPSYIMQIEKNTFKTPPTKERGHQIADALKLTKENRKRLIDAIMRARLKPEELDWVDQGNLSGGVREAGVPYGRVLSKEILEALQDPIAVKALLITHSNKKEIKDAINKLIAFLPEMEPEKRKAILALCA